jgi:hypothetical protein
MTDKINDRDYTGFEYSDKAYDALGREVCTDHFDDELNGTPGVVSATLHTGDGEFILERDTATNRFVVTLDGE